MIHPCVVISKCIEFEHCRYNGQLISSAFVRALLPFVTAICVCPEVEIGLGVPRRPVRIISTDNQLRLVQPATSMDVTSDMNAFIKTFLTSLPHVDGFILKFRSPSCGLKRVKIYKSPTGSPIKKGAGIFGGAVLKMFPHAAVEDEGRLKNTRIREHFLTKLFMLARFRQIKSESSMKDLVQFHTENKFLLMAYNQKEMRVLGRITANPEKKPVSAVVQDYELHLWKVLVKAPRYTSVINVLLHALGYFDELSSQEKSFFLDSLKRYREGKVPLSVLAALLKSWIIRFNEDYLAQQTFFEPYPEGLIEGVAHEKRDFFKGGVNDSQRASNLLE